MLVDISVLKPSWIKTAEPQADEDILNKNTERRQNTHQQHPNMQCFSDKYLFFLFLGFSFSCLLIINLITMNHFSSAHYPFVIIVYFMLAECLSRIQIIVWVQYFIWTDWTGTACVRFEVWSLVLCLTVVQRGQKQPITAADMMGGDTCQSRQNIYLLILMLTLHYTLKSAGVIVWAP